jgi:hypothetical protein
MPKRVSRGDTIWIPAWCSKRFAALCKLQEEANPPPPTLLGIRLPPIYWSAAKISEPFRNYLAIWT